MEVDEKTAKYTLVYNGKTYYFCAPACRTAFENNPSKYVVGHSGDSMHSGHCGC